MSKVTKNQGRYSVSYLYRLKITGRNTDIGTIYVRITVNGHRAPERSTKLSVAKADWNAKSQTITATDRESQQKNGQLAEFRTAIFDAQRDLERLGEAITGRKLIERIFGEHSQATTLKEQFGLYVAEKRAATSNSPKTFQDYDKYFRNLTRYFAETGLKTPLLDDITKARFQGLLVWLKEQYAQDYVTKNAQFLRTLISHAHANGLIDRNPLTTIRLEKLNHYDTTHLTQDQVQQLAGFDFVELPLPLESVRVLEEERDVFCWCSYTGLHHGDYSKGDYSVQFIKNRHWLTGHRIKSKGGRKDKPYSMPLHPLALAIIEKYGSVADLPKRNNAKRNVLLKQIAAYVGLNVHLTTKVARKTLAHYCLNVLGMKAETVAAVLGHTSTKFLKHYATISNEAIDREMQFGTSKRRKK